MNSQKVHSADLSQSMMNSTSSDNFSTFGREKEFTITKDTLRSVFHLPIIEAARRLGICTTILKRISRSFQIGRWPFRKINSFKKKIVILQSKLRTLNEHSIEYENAIHSIESLKNKINLLYLRPESYGFSIYRSTYSETTYSEKEDKKKKLVESDVIPIQKNNITRSFVVDIGIENYFPPSFVLSSRNEGDFSVCSEKRDKEEENLFEQQENLRLQDERDRNGIEGFGRITNLDSDIPLSNENGRKFVVKNELVLRSKKNYFRVKRPVALRVIHRDNVSYSDFME